MSRLANKVALITGAGRGIGRSAAERFAAQGARLILAEIDEATGKEAEAAIRAAGGEATFVRTDVSCTAAVQAACAKAKEVYGGLHVLYNNASVFLAGDDGPVTELSDEVWDRVLAINLRSVYLCCKHAIPLIIESGGGSVINTGSSASVMGIPGCDAYTATKGATVSLTRSMAVEYGPQGVRVNCICPAGVATEMVKASNLDDPNFDAECFFKKAPLGRLGESQEIADVAVFLASDESSYVNGAILRVDGGITITPIS